MNLFCWIIIETARTCNVFAIFTLYYYIDNQYIISTTKVCLLFA